MGFAAHRRLGWAAFAFALAGLACACEGGGGEGGPEAPAPAPALIARADLFGDASRSMAALSPGGDMIAFLAPRDSYLNIWVVPVATLGQARPVTDDQSRGVRRFMWAQDGATILFLQDERGDENWRLYAVPAAGGEARALTPAGARADILGLSPADPGGVVAMLNARDAAWPDVERIDIATGERTPIQRNVNTASVRGFAHFVVDRDNRLRLGLKTMPDGGGEIWSRDLETGRWARLLVIPFEDAIASKPLAFAADGASFLMLDSTVGDRAALVRVDASSGVKTVIGESPRADIVDVWLDPGTNAPEAFAADYLSREWRALDAEAQDDLAFLDAQLEGEPSVVSRSLDDKRWIVVEEGPTTPPRSYLYDRADLESRRLTLLFRHRPALERQPLQPMIPIEIASRDGLTLVSYLTLPVGSDANNDFRPDAPAPLVLLPHGGPWWRDSYGFNTLHQWLANRGYAVLSVNFRGSTGFGKAFLNQGNREWGARMQDDLLDAVQWALDEGVAQPDRVAILGGSYGGYAALAGLAFTPERFACGAAFAAPSNLTTLFDSIPPYWSAYREEFYQRVGDPRTPEGRQLLRARSPLFAAGAIKSPLLLAHGARDVRVAREETDAIAAALRTRAVPLTYLVYPDEGHGLARPQNRLSFFAVAEHFLAACLGGRAEPAGAAFDGAAIEAYDGAASVPGLSAFARRPAPAPEPAPVEPPQPVPLRPDLDLPLRTTRPEPPAEKEREER